MKKKRKKPCRKEYEFSPKAINEGVLVYIFDEAGCIVRNYISVFFYSENMILIETKRGRLALRGKNLLIAQSDCTDIKITGKVEACEFSGREA
mgnify:FL=1